MSYQDLPPCTVVPSQTHFEIEMLRQPPIEVEFSSDEEESAYEKADDELASRIHEIAEAACGDADPEQLIFTNWDWYPTRSRSLELDESLLSTALVQRLIQLLAGPYADWRIHLNVFKSLSNGAQEFGVACLWADRIVIQKSLHDRLQAIDQS